MDEKTEHRFELIDGAIANMEDQIEGVLAFVRNKPLNIGSNSILDILESTFEKLTVPSGIQVELPKNDIVINCDFHKLEVVFTNIIHNAIESMKRRGSIKIRIKEIGKQVIVEMEDSGIGIDESTLPRIFDPLFTTKSFGTGLGLAACKGIIEQHDGTITARNNPTTFSIFLPKNLRSEKVINTKKSQV